MQLIAADYFPPFRLKEFYQMRADKALGARYKCSLFCWHFIRPLRQIPKDKIDQLTEIPRNSLPHEIPTPKFLALRPVWNR